MAKECVVTGKSSLVGGKYSNRVRATQFNPTGAVRRKANLQKKKIFIPELNKTVTIVVSAKGLKTIAKRGAFITLKKAGVV
ncbi:MAG: bL28 family ribosomal protein [Patescibacteria group bacterium]